LTAEVNLLRQTFLIPVVNIFRIIFNVLSITACFIVHTIIVDVNFVYHSACSFIDLTHF